MKRILLLVVLLVFLSGKYGGAAEPIYVNHAATGSNNGTSWADAYKTLQAALTAAASGKEIWVAKGTYHPDSDYGLGVDAKYHHFEMINGVKIYGGFAGTETAVSERVNFGDGEANETILSGNTEACYHVIFNPDELTLDDSAILDGFTITGGNASVGTGYHASGGGIYCGNKASPTLINVIIRDNFAQNAGGGLYTQATTGSFKIENATIRNNTSYGNDGGGGICINGGVKGTITSSLIFGNNGVYGGGIECSGNITFTNLTIYNNKASEGCYGGGIDVLIGTSTLNNCIIWGNSATNGMQIAHEGGTIMLNNSCYSNEESNDVFGIEPSEINNCITTDPKFVNAAGNDFRLYGNSPCVNTGNNSYMPDYVSGITKDIRGQDRIQNTTIDMGAFEWTSGVDPTVPSATTNAASSLTTTTATLNGSVTANLASATVTFEYGTTTSYGTSVTADQSPVTGSTATSVSKAISGLSANTTYYYRVKAENGAGTAYGSEQTFTTPTAGTFTGNTDTNWNTDANWGSGSVPSSTTDVTIPTGATVVIGPTTTANCKNLTVEGTGSLTIQSNASGTGSLIISGTPSGNAIVQRYVTSGGWRLIASPVTGQTVGSFLTSTGTMLLHNPDNATNKAIKDYNEGGNEWNGLTYYTGNSSPMGASKGYAVWPASDGVVSFTGALQSGSKDITVVRGGLGWNCIGSPYTSAIAINSATGVTNFIGENSGNLEGSYGAIYVWEQGNNKYTIINQESDAFYAAVGQGFFVKAATAGSVNFAPAMQSHQTSASFKSGSIESPQIKLEVVQGQKSNSATVKFNNNTTRGLDFGYDAGIMETGFDVYTRLVEDNGVDFGIQSLPLADNYIIPVGIKSTEAGTVQLQLTSDLPSNYNVTFEDRERGITLPISENSKDIVFDVPANSTLANRFYLHVGSAAGIDNWGNNLVVTSGKGQITISGVESINGTATLYDVQGRKMSSVKLISKQSNTMATSGIRDGIYLLKVNQEGGSMTRKVAVNN